MNGLDLLGLMGCAAAVAVLAQDVRRRRAPRCACNLPALPGAHSATLCDLA